MALLMAPAVGFADPVEQTKGKFEDKFRQLEGEAWPTPTDYRNAAGEPGYRYWQQKVDYRIKATLDEAAKTITGSETVTYQNNSPDTLRYLWLTLDQNNYKRGSIAELTRTTAGKELTTSGVRRAKRMQTWEGGFNDLKVTDAAGAPLPFTVVDTLLRIDLAQPLKSGETLTFSMNWSFPIPETRVVGGRSGYECFTKPGEDGNCIFLGAQWFPRLAVYSDYEGWHNKAFVGAGEFTLEFGDYEVELTVPADHIVSATGELQNPEAILSAAQASRLDQAKTAAEPVYIVTAQEAAAAEKTKAAGTKTWRFTAGNVRDFAFASSRKFIWDAQGVKNADPAHPVVMAMSFYPKEARPLWDAYSTKSIAHTLKVYGDFAFPYPYPTAQSVNGPVGGMEYPMITFNGPRPIKDKKTGELTYTERAKYGLIGVVIHEVGHIWFPMTVNSDERQWTWMDEGINSFVEFQAHKQWDKKFPSRRGEPRDMIEYMVSENQVPIMTNSESIPQFGNNAYGKPATALVILRETVLGRETFDFAFKEYSRRWAFKRPTPYDFFRTMEEASGVDLDWFWRGWFYSTDHVDIELVDIKKARINTRDPEIEKPWEKLQDDEKPDSLTEMRNTEPTVVSTDPKTRDFYDETTAFTPTVKAKKKYADAMKDAEPELKEALAVKDSFYNLTFRNKGGLVMPVIVKLDFTDGTSETVRIPAEIWRMNPVEVTWQYVTPKTLKQAELDPLWETADANTANNAFPRRIDSVTLGITDSEEPANRMKDMELIVTPDSTKTAPQAKKDEKK
ncbi:M1 family metallopeptidase [Asticcacaulis sp. AC402]|uniref:M1 family metallopeptidase n=1 Tax=Asticcacaulis sp. AC402 TaxID=1282361 RepID=UPI0003C40222|nr:M1 family metallopeptidase [Asticcacaulis sp. AC402]ESQ74037.1 aminopeptidase [Asticcacaulis sp. AC402]